MILLNEVVIEFVLTKEVVLKFTSERDERVKILVNCCTGKLVNICLLI